jgi:putative transposase
VKKQCELLKVNRSSIYYRPKAASEADLALALRIDEIHLERPFLG